MIVELTLLSTFIFHHLLLGMFIGGALWLLLKMPWHITPQARALLWFTCYLLVTLLPFSAFLPSEAITKPTNVAQSHRSIQTNPGQKQTFTAKAIQVTSNQWHVPQSLVKEYTPLLVLLLLVWVLGITWRCIQLGFKLLNSKNLNQLLNQKIAFKINNNGAAIDIWLSHQCVSPMVVGLIHPKIIVPHALIHELTHQQLTHVILHEQAHIERHDLIASAIQEFIAICFWWSPIIRPLNRQIHLSRELACDNRAAMQSKEPLKYAQTLLDCAKLMFSRHKNILAMSLFNHKKDLTIRIDEVINFERQSSFRPLYTLLACGLLTISCVIFAHTITPKINVGQIVVGAKLFERQNQTNSQIIIKAVNAGQLDLIENLVSEGLDLDVAVISDGTPLIIAVKNNNLTMVKGLLNLGANVNQPSPGDANPLITAVNFTDTTMLDVLLQAGANINTNIPGDETALINAIRNDNIDMVRFLLNHGADINPDSGSNDSENRPLANARSNQMREFLIQQGEK